MSKKSKEKKVSKSKASAAAKLFFFINLILGALIIAAGGMQLKHVFDLQNSTGYSMMTSENLTEPIVLMASGLVVILVGWVGNIVIATFGRIESNTASLKKNFDTLMAAVNKSSDEEDTEGND